jgi:trigger factor
MKTKVESISDVVKKIYVDYDAKEVKPFYDKIIKDFKNTVSIPGFRKGKVPVPVIEKRFKKEILGELIRDLTKDTYEDILNRNKDEIGNVLFEEIFEFDLKPDKTVKMGLYLEVAPKLDLKDAAKLEVEISKIDNDVDKGVEEALKELQNKNAKFKPSRRKVCKEGDFVEVNLKAVDENGEQIMENKALDLELKKEGYWEKVAEKLIGAKVGEEPKEFEIEFEDEGKYGVFKGKKAKFTVSVNSIKEKEIAPLDDEFAKDMGEFDTLEELKTDIRKNLEKRFADIEKSEKQKAIVEKLLSEYEFNAPPSLAAEETKRMVQDYFNQLAQYGIKPDTDKEKVEAIYKQYEEAAKKRVKTSIILGKIAEAENLEVTEKDIDNEIKKMVEAYGNTVEPAALREMLENRGELSNMKNFILQEKTFDFLLKNIKFKTKKQEKTVNKEEDTKEKKETKKKTKTAKKEDKQEG